MSEESLHYEIKIDADPNKVYLALIGHNTYKQWTSVFNPASHFRGSWDKGSKILFVGCDEEGKEVGMVSRIEDNIKGKFISIEHIGELKEKEEITTSENAEVWAGSLENYTFDVLENQTHLKIDLLGGVTAYADFINITWPKALEKLKEICESH